MANIYNFTDTWNSGVTTYSAIKCTVTDTSSAADSALIDILVGGTSYFRVQKDGEISTQHYFSARQEWAQGTDLDDTDIDGSNILTLGTDGNVFQISGTQQIDAIASISGAGPITLVFTSARTLTHNASSFIILSGASLTTAAGDVGVFVHEGSGNWRMIQYSDASASIGATYLSNLVEDTTPQLGGNLDVNSNGITFPGATVTDVTGADTALVSGTAGTSGDLSVWNADGDLVDGPTPPSGTIVGTSDAQTLTNKTLDAASNTFTFSAAELTTAVDDDDPLFAGVADTLGAGFRDALDDDGTQSSGTYTPSDSAGTWSKMITNGGAFTLAPPSPANDEVIYGTILMINNASAGAVTVSGWTNTGGASLTTTNTEKFIGSFVVFDDGGTEYSYLTWSALQ